MYGIAFSQKRSVLLVKESIVKTESQLAPERKCSLNTDDIVVAGGFVVSAIGFVYGQKTTTLFPSAIAASKSSEKFGATDFKPFQVIGIVGNPHGIGVAV